MNRTFATVGPELSEVGGRVTTMSDPDPFAADGAVLSDEEWDRLGDSELDALAAVSVAPQGPPPPREPPFDHPRPARVQDRQLAVLSAEGAGEFLRACRASAGLSQRQVAEAAGVGQTTLARIEAGHCADVRLSTVVRLAEACEVMLVGTTAGYVAGGAVPLLESDLAQRHRDRGDRLLPAHLYNHPRRRPEEVSFPEHNDRPWSPRQFRTTRLRDVAV